VSQSKAEAAEQLLRRILQDPHRVIQAIANAPDRPAARAALQAEFDITEAEADMVLDQQFSLLIHDRLNKL
jgi:DNA gyrase/topoisomerase IV subunit A